MTRLQVAIALGLIVCLSAALYLTRLSYVPPYLMHDEVNFSLQAHAIATTARDTNGRLLPVYFSEAGFEAGRDPVMIYWTALFLTAQPLSETAVRLPTALLAVLSILLMFFSVRAWWRSDVTALMAAAFLALTPGYFTNARLALSISYGIPVVLIWIWCAAGAFNGRQRPAALGGAALGVGAYTYLGNLIVMPVLLVLTIGALARHGRRREAAWALGGFAVMLTPLAAWVAFHPDRFTSLLASYTPTNTAPAGVRERLTVFWMFFNPDYLFISGDSRVTNSTRAAGMFPLVFAIFAPLGFYRLLKGDGGVVGRLVAAGFALSPLATVVSGRLEINRVLIAIPFGVIVATVGAAYCLARHTMVRAGAALLVIGVLVQFAVFYRDYMGPYRVAAGPWFGGDNAAAVNAVLDRVTAATPGVYLNRQTPIERYWRFYAAARGRPDLAELPTYYEPASPGFDDAAPGALVVCEGADPGCLAIQRHSAWTVVARTQGIDGRVTHEVYARAPH